MALWIVHGAGDRAGRALVAITDPGAVAAAFKAGVGAPVSLHNRSLFYAHGQDPKKFELVVVKSPHCQDHMYLTWATNYINVDAPGATSANLKSLGHTICHRPVFPLDEGVEFTPEAVLYSP